MYLVLSGEGPSDLGVSEPGPIAWLLDVYIQAKLGYSLLNTNGAFFFASRGSLSTIAKSLPTPLRGKKADSRGLGSETRAYYKSARALCHWIRSQKLEGPVLAVLFRDADGTASAGRGEWKDKRLSILTGFHAESFSGGVPVVANPKSEAWLLCALSRSYLNCDKIEAESSGNDKSPKSLKLQLEQVLGELYARQFSCDFMSSLVQDGVIELARLDMPSANTVRLDLDNALRLLLQKS
jgi:hypothetical protein